MIFDWNKEKDDILKEERGFGFEDVVSNMSNVVDVIDNPSSNFSNQGTIVILINGYIHLVPFVKNGDSYFLKTIYKSRKFNKIYN